MYFERNVPDVLLGSALPQPDSGMDSWFIALLFLGIFIAAYAVFRLFLHRVHVQRKVLEKNVEERTSEISKQKEELQKQSEELQKAYEEIKTKNMAIEEAFEHLTNSFARLSDVNREKDGIMSIMAHDLRTPLTNIEGLIQLISMEDNLTDDQKNYIEKIRGVVKHGNELIRDILDINQAKNRKRELKLSKFNFHDFIENWRASFEESLSSKDQTLEISGDYETLELNTDAGLLSRIMDNLMSNAIKFSEKGKNIRIAVSVIDDNMAITISDEGPGISEEDQQNMFKAFTKLSARPTNGEPSNGLGLSIIKNLSKRMEGKIEVASELGKGTSFTLIIPKEAKQPAQNVKTPSLNN